MSLGSCQGQAARVEHQGAMGYLIGDFTVDPKPF
jgi:hypothetical protein